MTSRNSLNAVASYSSALSKTLSFQAIVASASGAISDIGLSSKLFSELSVIANPLGYGDVQVRGALVRLAYAIWCFDSRENAGIEAHAHDSLIKMIMRQASFIPCNPERVSASHSFEWECLNLWFPLNAGELSLTQVNLHDVA